MWHPAPSLSYIRRDVHGLRQLLQILEIQSVKVVAKKDLISQAILEAHPTAQVIMGSYFTVNAPRPPENTDYDDFIRYVQITRSSVSYMERKVLHSIDSLVFFNFEPKLVMENIRRQMRNGTLHLSCCALQDPTFHQLEDVTKHLDVMSVFRQDLWNYTPDEAVTSSRRADAVKNVVKIQKTKIQEAQASKDKTKPRCSPLIWKSCMMKSSQWRSLEYSGLLRTMDAPGKNWMSGGDSVSNFFKT